MNAFVAASRRPPQRGWTAPLAAYLVFCVVVLVMVWYRAGPQSDATDFRDFWENAGHFRETGEVASDLGVHNYLPFFTILMTPWSFLPLQTAAVLFVALSLALFALTVRMCEALLTNPLPSRERAGGGSESSNAAPPDDASGYPPVVPPQRGDGEKPPLPPGEGTGRGSATPLPSREGAGGGSESSNAAPPDDASGYPPVVPPQRGDGEKPPLPPREGTGEGSPPIAPLLIAAVLALPYVYACAVLGNVGLLLLFLVVACWFLVQRGHPLIAGAALGLATLVKLLPAALIVYFLLRRQWRVAAAAFITVIVLGIGWPLLSVGPTRTWNEHVGFYERAVRGHSASTTILADKPIKANYSNNALPIVLRRLLSPVDAGKEGQPLRVNVAALHGPAILGIYGVLIAVIAAASVLAAVRTAHGWAFAAWCCLMLLASPLVWTHYLPLTFWPLAMLADAAVRRRQRTGSAAPRRYTNGERAWALGALGVWLVAALLLAWPAARAAGAQIGSVLALWLVAVINALRARESRA